MDIAIADRRVLAAAEAAVGVARAAPSEQLDSFLSDLDTQLMLLYCSGEPHAASLLIRRNIAVVTRFVARIVRNPRVIEDLVQDVFVQVLTRARTYEPTARFSTWLYRIATNTALNHLRDESVRRRKVGPSVTEVALPDSTPPPDSTLSYDELRGRLAELIDDLPPNQRVALVLFDSEDFSYDQIAHVLSVTADAVGALLMRARSTLRRRLASLL